MKEGRINLYSDTQTRPSRAMREAMASAPVGDEQGFNDPTVNALCNRVAELLGKEAAVFLPSGTMCNEIALAVHCRPGDAVYAHQGAHISNFEGGGPSACAGATVHGLPGARGHYSAATLRQAVATFGRYAPRPRLVEVEQTAMMGGGAIWPLALIEEVTAVAREHGLARHLDGARLLNASVESGVSPATFAAPFDSAWICLTKGLGCPMGGVLAGSAAFIEEAWRVKQRMGGAMRQAGIIAAAGLYALDNNVERLARDHDNARRLAALATACEGVRLAHGEVETNLVFLDLTRTGVDAPTVCARLEAAGINVGAMGTHVVRAVTHLDVTAAMMEEAGAAFVDAVEALR